MGARDHHIKIRRNDLFKKSGGSLLLGLLTVILYQNCGKGFETILSSKESPSGGLTSPPTGLERPIVQTLENGYSLYWTYDPSFSAAMSFEIQRWGPMADRARSPEDQPPSWTSVAQVKGVSGQGDYNFLDESVSEKVARGAQFAYRIRLSSTTPQYPDLESLSPFAWTPHRLHQGSDQVHRMSLYWKAFDVAGAGDCPTGYYMDPEWVGRFGGNLVALQYSLSNDLSVDPNQIPLGYRKARERIALAKEVAARNGVPLRVFMYIRPDKYFHTPKSPQGFDLNWFFRMPRERFQSNPASLTFSDSTFSGASEEYKQHIFGNGDFFGYFYSRGPFALGDLSIPEYRAWMIRETKKALEYFGADGLNFVVKSGWLVDGYQDVNDANFPIFNGWCNSFEEDCTPYARGQFEGAVESYIAELRKAGVDMVIGENPSIWSIPKDPLQIPEPGPKHGGIWFSEDLKARILGVESVVHYPNHPNQCIEDLD